MTIHLVNNTEFKVTLDPIESSENPPSVSFQITARIKMPFQETALRINDCWITYDCLREFETQLANLRYTQEGKADLISMNNALVFSISRKANVSTFSVHSSDTVGLTASTIRVNGYATEINDFHHAIASYAKWW